jgi:hypothetical protein
MDADAYLRHAVAQFRSVKSMADRAIAQIDDKSFFAQVDPESNSVALNVKHVAGNLRSRWTDFLTTDGEKADRRRDAEFVAETKDTRASLLRDWEAGWSILFAALDPLTPAGLDRTVTIRGEPHTVFDAIERQKTHYAYHVGQIVFLAKHFAGPAWTSLSVARGQSEAFTAATRKAHGRS